MNIETVQDLIEELSKYPLQMRVGLNHSNSWSSGLSDFIRLDVEEADSSRDYEFKNHKNKDSSFFVDVLVIS